MRAEHALALWLTLSCGCTLVIGDERSGAPGDGAAPVQPVCGAACAPTSDDLGGGLAPPPDLGAVVRPGADLAGVATVTPDLGAADLAGGSASADLARLPGFQAQPTSLIPPNGLSAVWAVSATNVYVAGGGEILHSTGDGTWTQESLPGDVSPAGNMVSALWANRDGSDLWAVGSTVLRSTGNGTWTHATNPTTKSLYAVWGDGAGVVYFGGDQGVYRRGADGSFAAQSGLTSYVNSLWGSGPADVYAAGQNLYHSTGDNNWTMQLNTAVANGSVFTLWGRTSSEIWAGGYDGTAVALWRSSGDGNWVPQTDYPGTQQLQTLWGTGSGDLYAEAAVNLYHRVGSGSWSKVPLSSALGNSFYGIGGSGPTDVYLAGAALLHGP
jgi:hypothetical protein